MRKITCLLIMVLFVILLLGNISTAFSDTTSHWAEPIIDKWSAAGYVSGYDGKFDPDTPITRGQFVTILYRSIVGEEDTTPPVDHIRFEDVVVGSYFYKAAAYFYNMQVIAGYEDGLFHPEDQITREQSCVILTKLFQYDSHYAITVNKYSDKDKISFWAKDAVVAMVERSFITGTDNNELNPKGSLTRAETIAILNKIMPDIVEQSEMDTYMNSLMPKLEDRVREIIIGDIIYSSVFNEAETKMMIRDALKIQDEHQGEVTNLTLAIRYNKETMQTAFFFPYLYERLERAIVNAGGGNRTLWAEDYYINGEFLYKVYYVK